jgi:hypothetical protein
VFLAPTNTDAQMFDQVQGKKLPNKRTCSIHRWLATAVKTWPMKLYARPFWPWVMISASSSLSWLTACINAYSRLHAGSQTPQNRSGNSGYFAPLANRLGIWQLKWELEDLGFRYTNPEKYKEIAQNLAATRTERERQMQGIIDLLSKMLNDAGISVEITGRSKHIYSIWRKR